MFSYYYRILKHFFELKATSRKWMTHLIVSSLLRVFSFVIIPYAESQVVEYLTSGEYQTAYFWLGGFVASALLYVACHHYNFWAYYKTANDIHNRLQQKVLKKVTEFDPSFTADISKAALVNTAFNDIDKTRQVPDHLFDLIAHLVGIVICVVILCIVDWRIGGIAAILLTITLILFVLHTKKRDYYMAAQHDHRDEITSLYSQIIDGYKEVQTLDLKEDLAVYLEREKQAWGKYYLKQRLHRDFAVGLAPTILGFGRIFVYFFAAVLILSGEYSVALLVLVLGYYEDIVNRYDKIAEKIDEVSRSSVAIERLRKLLNYKTPHMLEFGNNNTDDIKGVVEFKNVSFVYTDGKDDPKDVEGIAKAKKAPEFKNISFKVEPNTLTAIVGKSGSGKSTIFRLLLRLYKTTKGKILLDGVDIYDYTKEVYATNVSIVTQKPFVFDMTIRENLNLVDSNHEHQVEACKIAGIHNDIMKLEKGYDTKLVADAENLSAGQKQLLSLVRTLLSKSEVLLFDEVTSSLDAATSAKIVEVLKKLKSSHTVLMVTHKPELMRLADNILVIDKGRLVAEGSHRDLLRSSPAYQTLQK